MVVTADLILDRRIHFYQLSIPCINCSGAIPTDEIKTQSNPISYDGNGRLFGIGKDCILRWTDIRQQLLHRSSFAERPVHTKAEHAPELHALRPNVPLTFAPQSLAFSADGSYAAITGPSFQDRHSVAAAVIDAAGARSAAMLSGSNPDPTFSYSLVDSNLFTSRPGLRILQLTWHPWSSTHFGILTQ
eukprot:jgi/Botrbrau1/16205/Bobra.160_1s0006.2